MTITATTQANFFPPRIRVDLDTTGGITLPESPTGSGLYDPSVLVPVVDGESPTDGFVATDTGLYSVSAGTVGSAIFETIALYRVISGKRFLVRNQPSTGGSVAFTYDYECPYGVPVKYEAVGTRLTSTPTTEWSEDWSDLNDWTGVTTQSVSGGKLSFASHNDSFLGRSLAGDRSYRVTANDMQANASIELVSHSNHAQVSVGSGSVSMFNRDKSLTVSLDTSAGVDVQIDVLSTSLIFTIAGVTYPFGWDGSSVFIVSVGWGSYDTGGVWGGQVVAASYPTTPTPFDEMSAQVTLNTSSGWIIHPLSPSLSLPVSALNPSLINVTSIGDVSQKATSTTHEILGQDYPIISRTGPRASDAFSITLMTRTPEQEAALSGLLFDQTPLLIRLNDPSFVWKDDFYSVGDVTRARLAQTSNQWRNFTLPLRAVQAPVGGALNAGWSWAAAAAQYASWNEFAAAFNSWSNAAAQIGS